MEVLSHGLYEVSRNTMDALDVLCQKGVDLVEVCAPWDSPLCDSVERLGGKTLRLGLRNGFDLSTKEGLRKASKVLRECRPRKMHLSPPCFPWTAFQNLNQKTEQQKLNLVHKRQMGRRLLKNMRTLAEIQMFELQGDISGEQPWTASSWNEKPWNHICKLAGGRFKVDGCAFGLKDVVSGKLMHKSWGFFSSHPGVKRRLGKTCNHAPHDHVRIEGRLTASSAVYPRKLCDAFAKGLFDRTVEFTAFSRDVAHLCAKETHFEKCAGIFASRSAQSDARPGEEQDAGENEEEGEAIDGEREGRDEQGEEQEEDLTPEEVTKLKLVHRNLGHPSSAVLIRAMKHAGVAGRFIHAAKRFECEFCKRQALRKPVLPATLNQVQEKWQVLSIDTFWWKHQNLVQTAKRDM